MTIMKKIILTAFASSIILVSLMVVLCAHQVQADSTEPIHFIDAGLTIYSPVNTTYYYRDLFLNLSLGSSGILGSLDPNISMNYSIDNTFNRSVPLKSTGEIHMTSRAVAQVILPDLTNGSHNLTIHLYGLNQRSANPKYLTFALSTYFSTTGNPAPTITPTSVPTSSPSPTHSPIPSPSVPEFTIDIGDSKAIVLTITNQPFVPYFDANIGNYIKLYYDVRVKFHSDQNWTNLYYIEDVPTQSNSTFKVLSYVLSDENGSSYFLGDKLWEVPTGSQLDFQVEAMVGYIHRLPIINATVAYPYVFTGEASGWSKTQTLTIGTGTSPSPSSPTSSNITPSPTIPEFPSWIILPIITIVTLATLAYFKKIKKQK